MRAVAHALVDVTGVRFGKVAQQRQIGAELALDGLRMRERRSRHLGRADTPGVNVVRDLGGAAQDRLVHPRAPYSAMMRGTRKKLP